MWGSSPEHQSSSLPCAWGHMSFMCGGVRDLQLAEAWVGDASSCCHSVIGGSHLDYSPGMQSYCFSSGTHMSCICPCAQALKKGFCRDTVLLPRANIVQSLLPRQ